MLVQSKAILRYIGSIGSYNGNKLYPEDPKTRYYCDEVIDIVEDIRPALLASFGIKDQAEKEAFRAALVKPGGKMYPGLEKLNARLAMFDFAAGPNPTIADVYLVPVVYMFQQPSFLDGFPEDSLKPFPNIVALKNKLMALPPMREYYKEATGIRAPFKV